MANTDELRRELQEERVELTEAVATLREKVDAGKRVASKVSIAAAGVVGLRLAARLLSRRR
jgi:Protein of unknown function (DUF3618)